jgi:hypothetical protein
VIACPNCGKENQDHYKFCLGCGTKLPAAAAAPPVATAPPAAAQPAACSSCGTENPPGFRFCGRCGAKLADPVGAAPSPAPDMGSARTMFVDAGSAPPFPAAAPAAAPAPAPMPAPAVVHRARLVLLRDDGSDGGMLALEGGPEVIGRGYGPPFDTDAYLEPEHVGLTVTAAGLQVDDRSSLNGVYVKLRGPHELHDQDQFRVGQELLVYQDLPEPTPSPDGTERMGSPNPGYWGRVSVVVEPGRLCAAQPIKDEGLQIGREDGDLTFPEDGYVSGRHCRIYGDDAGVFIEDLGSSNGTYLRIRNGQVIPFSSLVLIGQQLFRLDPG